MTQTEEARQGRITLEVEACARDEGLLAAHIQEGVVKGDRAQIQELIISSGADFLCYVTPAEHLRLPSVEDIREGVIVTKIATKLL